VLNTRSRRTEQTSSCRRLLACVCAYICQPQQHMTIYRCLVTVTSLGSGCQAVDNRQYSQAALVQTYTWCLPSAQTPTQTTHTPTHMQPQPPALANTHLVAAPTQRHTVSNTNSTQHASSCGDPAAGCLARSCCCRAGHTSLLLLLLVLSSDVEAPLNK
jgi:hypothetical protein